MDGFHPDCVVVTDSLDRIESTSSYVPDSQARVQRLISRGLTRQDSVYIYLTEKLISRFKYEFDESKGTDRIRRAFEELRDLETGYLSNLKFQSRMATTLSALGVNGPGVSLELLLNLFRSLAFYPFPIQSLSFGEAPIDEDAFLRSVIILALNQFPPFRGLTKYEPPASSGAGCAAIGPHTGRFTTVRAHGARDFRRRVFRGLGIPHQRGSNQVTTLQVPYFDWIESREKGEQITEEDIITRNYDDFVLVVDEEEWSVDTVDVLADCLPRPSKPVMAPMRDAYKLALPGLPRYTHDLTALHIPTPSLVSILKTVQSVQKKKVPGLVHQVRILGVSGEISWATFEYVIAVHSDLLSDGLSTIFGAFVPGLEPTRKSFDIDDR